MLDGKDLIGIGEWYLKKKNKKKLHRRGVMQLLNELQLWIALRETVRELRCNSMCNSMGEANIVCCELIHIMMYCPRAAG